MFDLFRSMVLASWKVDWTGVEVVCSQTWPGNQLSYFLELHREMGSTLGPWCVLVGEAAGLLAVGGLACQRYWSLGTEGLLRVFEDDSLLWFHLCCVGYCSLEY